ncbi:MAG: 1-acyl-sn-glycerol-3-phosphate acyltransferase [Janthinobacterium sp.]|jgi:1-acyl-sn-glycerol-3-phosphate acyltransferase
MTAPASDPAIAARSSVNIASSALLLYRLLRVTLQVFVGMAICALVFPWLGSAARNRHIQRWSRSLLRICGVTVASTGEALAHAMVVSNHVSWLDIFVINTLHPCRFVAKAEIRGWPMLGWLADKAGTVFIARGQRRDLRHIFKGLVHSLQNGERIAFFPEGTTAVQGQLLPFHANLFEAAIDAGVPVQAIAVSYVDAQGYPHASVEFVGDMTFARSLMAILSGRPITARLAFLVPITAAGAHRRDLAQASHAAVAAALKIVI